MTRVGDVEVDVHSSHLVMGGEPVVWDSQTEMRRRAIVRIMRDALLRMAENVEDWLPGEVMASSNERFGVVIHWHTRFLDQQILKMHAEAERDSEQRLADLKRLAGRHGAADSPSE